MTEFESLDYLESRASRHGMTVHDLMEMTPDSVSDCPQEAAMFWEGKHVSHILPQSEYAEYAHDPSNMMPEDGSPNMARGATVMTDAEISAAHADNQYDAQLIDVINTCDTHSDYSLPDLVPFLGFV